MIRNIVLPILLVALVMLAGCGGTADTDPADTTTTTSAQPATAEFPEGYNETGIENAEVAASTHADSLTEAESWSVVYDSTFEFPESDKDPLTILEQRTVDLSGEYDQSLSSQSRRGTEQTVYINGTDSYKRIAAESGDQYEYQKAGLELQQASYSEMVKTFLVSVDYKFVETTVTDGTTLFVYEGTDLYERNELETGANGANVTDMDSRVVVDSSGLVHEVSFSGMVDQNSGKNTVDFTVTFSDVGSTDVVEPAWLDAAVEATSSSSSSED